MARGDNRRRIGAGTGCALAALLLSGCSSTGTADGDTAGTRTGAADLTPQKGCGGELPAFPGAEGFGCATPGGRGGQVLVVSNLEDSGPGSLREALEASGRRVAVFAVSGTIDVREQIVIDDPYLTVAGRSRPTVGARHAGEFAKN